MRTWNDYKEHVREVDPIAANDINEIENSLFDKIGDYIPWLGLNTHGGLILSYMGGDRKSVV